MGTSFTNSAARFNGLEMEMVASNGASVPSIIHPTNEYPVFCGCIGSVQVIPSSTCCVWYAFPSTKKVNVCFRTAFGAAASSISTDSTDSADAPDSTGSAGSTDSTGSMDAAGPS